MGYTREKDYQIDSQQRAVIRVPESEVAKYLSAPEMYQALKAIFEAWCNNNQNELRDALDFAARKALAKAESK